MYFQIFRTLCAYASSVVLIVIGVISFTILSASDDAVAGQMSKENDFLQLFVDHSFQETYFLKIDDNPSLNITDSLLLFIAVLFVVYILWYLRKPKVSKHTVTGFKILNLNDQELFIPLKEQANTLEFLEKISTNQKYRLSANLNRVNLTPHQNTYLLEDKNFKNALLINRRRSHNTILCDNDVLDIGEMMLLYCNKNVPEGKNLRTSRMEYNLPIYGVKPKGPVRKGTPILSPTGSQHDILLLRNTNSIGSSRFNDIVIRSDQVALRHTKIYKIGKSWKIQNLLNHETTSVNGRRIDQRFLNDGDEIAVGNILFKFRISKSRGKQVRISRSENAKKSVKN